MSGHGVLIDQTRNVFELARTTQNRRSEHGKGQRDQAIIRDTKHVCLLI
jgi:hypothetical protein